MTALSSRLDTAFQIAVGELGMWTASWLFVRELGAARGDLAVAALGDDLGRSYATLDAVARQWQQGAREPRIATEGILELCEGATNVVFSGLETALLDALLPRLAPGTAPSIVLESTFAVDWSRVISNYDGRLEGLSAADLATRAGARSVLVAFAYGTKEHVTFVNAPTLRTLGPDVRTLFRSVVAWETLGEPMHVYPRWLSEVSVDAFSHRA